MAKKFSMGALIAVGAAAAAIGGGVAAYLNRETLKQVANDISEKLASRKEEDDFFEDFEEETVVHATDKAADESDFVDAEGVAEVEEPAEAPAEEPEAPAAQEAVEA